MHEEQRSRRGRRHGHPLPGQRGARGARSEGHRAPVQGWAVFGERQFVRGYALLLPDPVVPTLNALGARERIAFLSDMSRLGDALLKVTGALRINYAIFGNEEPALHAHVIPRYLEEPEALRTQQPWAYDWSAAPAFDRAAQAQLAESLLRELDALRGGQADALRPRRERRKPETRAGPSGPALSSSAHVDGRGRRALLRRCRGGGPAPGRPWSCRSSTSNTRSEPGGIPGGDCMS